MRPERALTNTKELRAKLPVGRATALKVAAPIAAAIGANTKIRILIADDHTISRCGLRKLLETQPDFVIVGEATGGAEAVRSTHELKPDVLLLVLSMPELGLDVLRQMNGDCATVRTILLTPAIDTSDTVNVLHFGARGIVLKASPTDLLFMSIRCVFGGELWLGREAISDVVQALFALNGQRTQAPASYRLTAREREVLTLVVTGYTNKDIAQKLSIAEDTVKHHLSSIFDKTGVSNRLELALFAIHHRFVANP